MESIHEISSKAQREYGAPILCVGSIKANVGWRETAAGVGSLMKVLAMLQHSKVPPLAAFKALDPNIPPLEPDNLCVNTEVLRWAPRPRQLWCTATGRLAATPRCCEAPKSLDRIQTWTNSTPGR